MKRIFKALLIVVLFFTLLPFFHELHEDEDHNHEHEEIFHVHVVHALAPGDDVGECTAPGCVGGRMKIVDLINNVTCTSDGYFLAMCNNCGYSEYRTPPALGHNPVATITIPATCTTSGSQLLTCGRCGANLGNSNIPALGHNLKTVTTKYPTCTESGLENTHCTRCSDEYNTIKAPLGHDWKESIVDPTCTEDGYYSRKCNRCNEEEREVIKALGHDLSEFVIIKEATCEEDGLRKAACKRCNEEVEEIIKALGHKYPEEWTIEKDSGYFSEGLKSKICTVCKKKLEEIIPKKDSAPLLIGGGATGLGLGALVFFWLKKKSAVIGVKLAKEVIKDGGLFKPSVEDKSIVLFSKDEKIIETLKDRPYLKISTCEFEEIKDTVVEKEPDLLFACIYNKKQLNELIKLKKEDLSEFDTALLIDNNVIKNNKKVLDKMVENKELINYLPMDSSKYDVMVKLILPILKPNMKSDETLENIGGVADLLGIPGISTVLDLFIAGRDIKSTLEEGELGISEQASLISTIASVLGFDTVASVTDLVSDIDDIKASLDKQASANDVKGGIKASKDIVEVVTDLLDKD